MAKSKDYLFILLGIITIWFGLLLYNQNAAPTQTILLASIIYFLCCLPTVIYFYSKDSTIPYLPFFGIFYFVYFGLSIFSNYKIFLDINVYNFSYSLINTCLIYALAGFLSMMVAFYSPIVTIAEKARLVSPLTVAWDIKKAYKIALVLGVIGNIAYYFTVIRSLPVFYMGIITFLGELSRLSFVILYMIQSRGELNFKGKLFLWFIVFIPRILLSMTTGTTFAIIIDFVLLFFIDLYYRQRLPWKRIILAAVMFFFVFSARDKYRDMVWYRSGTQVYDTAPKRIKLYFNLIYDEVTQNKETYTYTYEKLSARADYMVTFVSVVALTPDYIPFWDGYTYQTLFTSIIPRVIMPDKPLKNVGQSFGHRYGFLEPWDTSTAYNLPFLIEMYVNFGAMGIIVGMFILGIVFRIFYILLNTKVSGEGIIAIGAMIFSNLLNVESDLSLMFGHMLQYIILFYIIIKWASRSPARNRYTAT